RGRRERWREARRKVTLMGANVMHNFQTVLTLLVGVTFLALVARRLGIPTPSDDVWMRGLGTPLWVQFRHFTEDPAEIEAMVATYRAYNLANHDDLVRPYAGVVEAVLALRDRGKSLGLVTSKMRSGALRGLRAAGLEDAFQVIVGADEVTHPKPHPEPVLTA